MQYRSHQSPIESNNSFTIKVEDLIREIVIQNDIPYYRIESAVEHNSAPGAEDTYMPVIRIITYFEDTVNKISHILHEEFDVDIERSVDKKKIRIETFAYKNINYTANLKTDRQQQTVYKRSGGKKFEIQICSMLQDAWSGIEKELGYDTNFVPDEAKRDFYRVGALLEMADIEFLKIRTELGRKMAEKQEEQQQEEARQPVARPLPQQAAPQNANVSAPPAEAGETNTTTFIEHLESVAKSIQKEEPLPQSEPVAFTPPVAQQPIVVAQPVLAEAVTPSPVAVQQPEQAATVVAAQQPVFAPPPVQEPVEAPAPVATRQPAPVATARIIEMPALQVAASIPVAAPQYIAPVAPPAGIAPKPTIIPAYTEPVATSIAAAAHVDIDNLKELAQSINNTEVKVPLPVVELPQPYIIEQSQPTFINIPQVIAETPVPEPVPEVTAPIAEQVLAAAPSIIMPVIDTPGMNVNGNGIIEHVADVVSDNGSEKAVPFYNEAAKVVKAAVADENAQMTDITLREYVMNSKLLKEVDQQIAERAGAKINTDVDIEGDVERLRFLKVYSIKQLHDRITDNKNDIVAFAEKWIGKDNGGSFDSGISLFYLEYLLVGKKNDPAFAVEYVVKFISDNDYSARYIIPTYNSIHNTEAPNFSHLTLKA